MKTISAAESGSRQNASFSSACGTNRQLKLAAGPATSLTRADDAGAFDTNVLAYAEGVGDSERCRLVMAVAAENRCRILLTEDLQHGFTWRGVTIINPFVPDESPLLAAILSQEA
jgi:hypothetical protein